MEEGKTAIILGATGLTGSTLLKQLLNDDRYKTIKLFSRSSINKENPKIKEYIVDMFDLMLHHDDFTADEVFCCIGTTKSKTPDKAKYKAIDYGIPVAAAMLCKKNNINTYAVISSMGADSESAIFYNRIKGKMEDEVMSLHIPKTFILQPSLIAGKRDESRPAEWFFKQLMKGLNYIMVGPLKKYQSITPDKIAKSMVYLANSNRGTAVIKNDEIQQIAKNL
ncbi:NAD-dependent epimerase/dehydratase family protein [Joostella sp.]|uniref:NAD-dependent epimerase/dehydratase family protein n=1 Tax=Joostella sp. TaxID=2231138 RepID=UPI003A9305EF